MTATAKRLELREQMLLRVMSVAPYLLLVTSAALSMLTGGHAWNEQLITGWLVLVAAAWMWLMSHRREPGAVYVAGLLLLIAVLCTRDVWFAGFFGFVGYLHSWRYLRREWRFVGVTVTAAISVTTFMGGAVTPTPVDVLAYLFFIGAVVAGVGLFSSIGDTANAHSAERKRMVAQLQDTIAENEGLHAQLLVQAREAGVVDERQRIARDIHDTIAQGLAGIVTQLQAAERAGDIDSADTWRHHFGNAMTLARDSLAEARRSLHAIGPAELESARLPEAIAAAANGWGRVHEVAVAVTTTGDVRPLHPNIEVTFLRVAQEALANVGKHADARRVGLTLSYMEDVVTLDVRDDGSGFDQEAAISGGSAGFGLISMRQRVGGVSGVLEIESAPGLGTAISASVPIAAPADDGAAGGRMSDTTIRVLIADDHPVVRDGLRGMFDGDARFEVVGEASDGLQAIALARALEPTVVLMDLRMPRMGGVAAIKKISELGLTTHVLVLTTYETDSEVLPAFEAGAIGYLLKDARSTDLMSAVEKAARGEAVVSPKVASRLRDRSPDAGSVLTERELAVLRLVASGATFREGAAHLFISVATFKTHISHIYAKLAVSNGPAAVASGFERGLLDPDRG